MVDPLTEAMEHVRALTKELKPYHAGRRVRDCAACDALKAAQAWLSRLEQSGPQPVIETAGEIERLTVDLSQAVKHAQIAIRRARDVAERETIERCAALIEGGSFLHDQSPAYQFAKEAARAIRALKTQGERT